MKESDLFNKIISTSDQAEIVPSEKVWEKLERRLDSRYRRLNLKPKFYRLSNLSIAASVIILVGLFSFLFTYSSENSVESLIQLEDLHTLELNSEFNAPKAGDATTIPSILMAEPVMTSYSAIEEGPAGKKLIERSKQKEKTLEYGLG